MQKLLEIKEVNYNTMFYSAFKSLIVLELLLESPKTFKEILAFFDKLPYMKKRISSDTFRVYLNTFKKMGCEIEKTLTGKNRREYAYFIPINPFRPKISESQAQRLFNLYDVVMYNMPFEDLLKMDMFINKLNQCFKDEKFEEFYKKHSVIKDFDTNLLHELDLCCKDNSLVTVLYNSPRSGYKEIPIIAHKMKIQNYKLYLEGFGLEYNQEAIFLLNRIEKITNVIPGEEVKMPENCFFDITFELYDTDAPLVEGEELLSENNGVRLVKHTTSNKVLTTHRFLQLANTCKILEPAEYRKEFIDVLKGARKVYDYGE